MEVLHQNIIQKKKIYLIIIKIKRKKKMEERKIDRCYESWEGHPMTNNVPEACINCTNIF